MIAGPRALACVVAVAVLMTGLVLATPLAAHAQDGPETTRPDATSPVEEASWPLPFESLGYPAILRPELFTGTVELDVPEIDGLETGRFRAVLAAAGVENNALVTVYANGVPIGEIDLGAGSAETLDLVLPPDTTSVSVAARALVPSLVECPVRTAAMELRDASVVYEGTPLAPTHTDDFLPPALHGVTIAIDERSDRVDQSVVDLATALARRYPDRFTVDVVPVAPGEEPTGVVDPFRRTFWIRSDGPRGPGLTTGADFPALRVPAEGSSTSFVDSSPATGLDAEGRMALIPRLASVGVTEGAGHAEVRVVANQAVLGAPHHDLFMRVGGRITPLAGGLPETTSVSLWAGERLLETTEVDEVGRFDIEHAVDNELVDRDTVFLVSADAPRQNDEQCDGGPPLRLELDEGSWLSATPGQPLPLGFDRYPQSLLEGHDLFIGDSIDDLEAAAGLMALLQNASANPLGSTIASPGSKIDRPAVFVGGSTGGLDDLGPASPVAADGLASFFGRSSGDVAAVLQVSDYDGHDIVALRSRDRGAQTRLVALAREPGFTALTGTVVGLIDDDLVRGTGGQVDDRALLPPLSDQSSGPSSFSTTDLFIYGVLGAAAVMGLALALGPIRQLLKR